MTNNNPINNERGLAIIETLAMMVIILVLFSYTLGLWGITHTAILHNIAAKNYANEIFRHRASLWYFRINAHSPIRYHTTSVRLHGVQTDANSPGDILYATERRIALFQENDSTGRSSDTHFQIRNTVRPGQRNEDVAVDPVWVKVKYGLCLTAACGDN